MADSDSADSPKDDPRDKFKPLHERLRVTAACAEELKPILYALSKIKAGAPSRSSVIEKGKLAQAVWYSHKMNDLKLHSEIYDAAETPERARTVCRVDALGAVIAHALQVFSQAVRNCSKGNPPWLKEYTKKIIASCVPRTVLSSATLNGAVLPPMLRRTTLSSLRPRSTLTEEARSVAGPAASCTESTSRSCSMSSSQNNWRKTAWTPVRTDAFSASACERFCCQRCGKR